MKVNKVKRLQVKEGEGLHTHAVASEKEDIIVVDTKNADSIRFQVTDTKSLVHEEHYPIPLEKGKYSVGEQQEFDYFTMNVRTVFD